MLFFYLWLVGSIHRDYLSYAELQADQSLAGTSFVYKWAALISGVIVYLAYHTIRRRSSFNSKKKPVNNLDPRSTEQTNTAGPDPFAEIRLKEKLRSRAEMMIDKEKK